MALSSVGAGCFACASPVAGNRSSGCTSAPAVVLRGLPDSPVPGARECARGRVTHADRWRGDGHDAGCHRACQGAVEPSGPGPDSLAGLGAGDRSRVVPDAPGKVRCAWAAPSPSRQAWRGASSPMARGRVPFRWKGAPQAGRQVENGGAADVCRLCSDGVVTHAMNGMFHSLRSYNYRLWAMGALVSNVGTWMQRIGQDWLVLTVLTRHNATAVGTVMALQFGPPLLLLAHSGLAADHLDRRKLLLWTQGASGVLALGLGLLTLSGVVQLWQVYGFALLLGCVTAFDAPARQAFVSNLVTDDVLATAVALNSASFNGARMIGPAVA